MGYQVGNICYTDRVQAENAYFSLVSPVIQTTTAQSTTVPRPYPYTGSMTVPGKTQTNLIAPQYTGGKWTLNGQTLTAQLPPCDPAKNMKDGAEAGWLFFGVMAACYVFVVLKRLLR